MSLRIRSQRPAELRIQLLTADPGRRDQRAERDHAGGEEMQSLADLVDAEQHYAEETGFEKKAASTSDAMSGPTIGPALVENTDQFVPN